MRLNKFLAERLGISRRMADNLIAKGEIFVVKNTTDANSEKNPSTPDSSPKIRAELGYHLDKNDEVWYNEKIVPQTVDFTYLALNKPVGYVCSRRRQGDTPTIYELLPAKYRSLKTVGRLDKDSSGLILLTNDGDFAFSMTHPKFIKEKIYEVELGHDLTPQHQQMIADFGVELADGRSQMGLSHLINDASAPDYRRKWQVTLTEGRNRQIRRTFLALGYRVIKLHRVQFGKYRLDGLKSGEMTEIRP